MTRPLDSAAELRRTRIIRDARAEGLDVAAINELLTAHGLRGPEHDLAPSGNLWADVQAHTRRLRLHTQGAA